MARRSVKSRTTIGSGGLLYLIVAVLLLGTAVYSQANLLFWAFGLMVGGLALSLVLSVWMMSGLDVQRQLPSHGVAEESLVIRYRVTNAKFWMPTFGLVVNEIWGRGRSGWKHTGPVAASPARLRGRPFGWLLHIGPRQEMQAEANCWPLRRGELVFERVVLSTSFPFGVVRRTLEFDQPAAVLVYPRLFRVSRKLLVRLTQAEVGGRRKTQTAGGDEDFFGLRDYLPGDSLRLVDWKRTARTGDLVVREYTQASPPKIMLALDLSQRPTRMIAIDEDGRPTPDAERSRSDNGRAAATRVVEDTEAVERAVSLAASIVCDAHFHGFHVGLAMIGAAGPAFSIHHSLPHRARMLDAMARLDTGARVVAPQPLPARPSVVVTPGQAPPAQQQSRSVVLGAADLHEYVVHAAGASMLTGRRLPQRSRRHEFEEARP